MSPIESTIESLGLPARDPMPCPDSTKRFPDGGQYRIEIPSTEGPAVLRTVIDEATAAQVADKASKPGQQLVQIG